MPRIEIEVDEAVFQFEDLNHWKTAAARLFGAVELSAADVLCVDARGRICVMGSDFMRAETERTYPILVYPIPAFAKVKTAARAAQLREEEQIDRAYERINRAYERINRAFPLAGHEDRN